MSTGLANREPYRKAIRSETKLFSGISILTVKTNDGSWVLYSPIPDIIGETSALASLCHMRVWISVDVGGKEVPMEFVSRADFLGASIISSRNAPFRDFVVKLLEQLEDKGFVVTPNHSDNPLVAVWSAGLETALKVAEMEKRQETLERGQVELGDRVDGLMNIVHEGQCWRPAMMELVDRRKICIASKDDRSKVGKEIAALGRSLGYPVDTYPNGTQSKYAEIPFGGYFPIHYPAAVLIKLVDIWIKRNLEVAERASWFRKMVVREHA